MIYKIKDVLNDEILYECSDVSVARTMADMFTRDEGLEVKIFVERIDGDEELSKQ